LNQPNPTQPNPTTYQAMNHTSPPYFNNDVKFTGSAFESPGDIAPILMQFGFLLMIIFGFDIENERRN
jgi:hypothetical protein